MEHNGEGDAGPSTSNTPLGEIRIALTKEIDKLRLEDSPGVPSTLNKPLIQKVPQNLRSCYSKEDCERYFKPTAVALGPLHHQRLIDKDLRMERGDQCKLKLAAMFINDSRSRMEDFYENVKGEIKSLRNCYDAEVVEKWNDEQLAEIFLVDGCALLHFIVLDVNDNWERFSVNNGLVSIQKTDFFLLENQLPYQLLEILIDSFAKALPEQSAQNNPKELLKKCITEFINRSFLRLTAQQEHHRSFLRLTAQQEYQIQNDHSQPHHLLDLLRRKLIGEKGGKREGIKNDGFLETLIGDKGKHLPLIRNVRELKDKGIRFKAREKGGAITNIDFKDRFCMATLTLPPIFLHNTTMPLLLNLMAYELCPDFKEDCEITSHLSFLHFLINNREDAKELRVAGVLHNGLGSDEAVVELFNKISGILVPYFKIDPKLKREIYEYSKSYKSHFMEVIHTYFGGTWSFSVFISALAHLSMQGMQTYYRFQENKLR